MKKKAKKITSVVLVLAVMLGTFSTMFSLSTSAVLNKDGTYFPDEGIEFYKYYFAMPETWNNSDYLNYAGIYWEEGTGACGEDAEGPVWPGYLTYTNKYWEAPTLDPDYHRPQEWDLYYAYVPQDVPSIIWNNYWSIFFICENNNDDTDRPFVYLDLRTTVLNVGADLGYHKGDGTYYDTLDGFWDLVNDAWENNKDQLGDNAECFAEGSNGLAMTFNNMVYVIDDSKTTTDSNGCPLYSGEWYFLYGNDYYGSWPTEKMAKEQAALGNGVYNHIHDAIYSPSDPDPDDPTPTEDPTEEPWIQPIKEITTEPTSEPTTDPTTKPTVQPNTDETKSTEETVKPTIKPQPATSSGSSTNSNASTTNSSVVQTGDISYALVLLTILAIAVCIVWFARKKKFD